MKKFVVVAQPMGIFLRPLDGESQEDNHRLAATAAQKALAMIKSFNGETMMILPCTIPDHWGTFLFGKITVSNWTGLETYDVNGKIDTQFQKNILERLKTLKPLVYSLPVPDSSDSSMPVSDSIRFLLGRKEFDASCNGPIVVSQSYEQCRHVINEIRSSLGLGHLHPDCKVHVSICRLTGRNAEGKRDDQLFRNMMEPRWPTLPSGAPAMLSELPIHALAGPESSDQSPTADSVLASR